LQRLDQNSQVVVVGGGPAGSLFALHLLEQARRAGLQLGVTIHEPRSFTAAGAKGCNMCAGILSAAFVHNLARLNLAPPPGVIMGRIGSYQLHTEHGSLEVKQPHPLEPILAVYRGGGPDRNAVAAQASLDAFLLERAIERGAQLEPGAVDQVHLDGERPVLVKGGQQSSCDLLVLATGVNARLTRQLPPPYTPPPTRKMMQVELTGDPEQISEALGSQVHVVLVPGSRLDFGTLIPKGEHVTVCLLGRGRRPMGMDEFLDLDITRRILPPGLVRACRCQPRIAAGPARRPFGQRWVVVGDAAVARHYKDGIGSAFETARVAAHTAVWHGVSRRAFTRHYRPLCRRMAADNRYGRLLFAMHRAVKDSPRFLSAQVRILHSEQNAPYPARRLHPVTWGMYTGAHSYRGIFLRALSPRLWLMMARYGLMPKLRPVGGPGGELVCTEGPRARILVLGGGFAGVHTALRLEKALRREPGVSITVVSDQNYTLFAPMLHEVASGRIETRHIAIPIRRLRGDRYFKFIQARISSVDLERKVVHCSRGELSYDRLVLALGSVPDRSQLTDEASHVLELKTLRDAIVLRNHLIRCFETAANMAEDPAPWLTFVVVGAGAPGVQAAAELCDFVGRSLPGEYVTIHARSIRVLLVQRDSALLPELHPSLVRAAIRTLESMRVELLTGTAVTAVGPGWVELNSRERVHTRTVVWTPGVRANPVVAALPVDKDDKGRVRVDSGLELPGHPGVFAMGDNADLRRADGGELPPTAQLTTEQPRVVAANLVASLLGGPRESYRHRQLAQMVSLGARSALVELLGMRFHGYLARLMWLIVHARLIEGYYNRLRVVSDWLLTSIFGLDSTLLRVDWKRSGSAPPLEPQQHEQGPDSG